MMKNKLGDVSQDMYTQRSEFPSSYVEGKMRRFLLGTHRSLLNTRRILLNKRS